MFNQFNSNTVAVSNIELFSTFETWEERYEYLMELGSLLPVQPESFKKPERRVSGCQSRVWLDIQVNSEGIYTITAESDALIVRGLLYVIQALYSGKNQQQIQSTPQNIPAIIGLEGKLSITRLNGLQSVLTRIYTYPTV